MTFLKPEGIRCVIRQLEELSAVLHVRAAHDRWLERGPGLSRAACGTVLEIALSLAELGLAAGASLAFLVTMRDSRTPISEPTSGPVTRRAHVPRRTLRRTQLDGLRVNRRQAAGGQIRAIFVGSDNGYYVNYAADAAGPGHSSAPIQAGRPGLALALR